MYPLFSFQIPLTRAHVTLCVWWRWGKNRGTYGVVYHFGPLTLSFNWSHKLFTLK